MTRYNNVAIALHWLLAILVIAQIYVGWTFGDMERGPARGRRQRVAASGGDGAHRG